jgi:hypothetical protein
MKCCLGRELIRHISPMFDIDEGEAKHDFYMKKNLIERTF